MTGRNEEALAVFDRALARQPRDASLYRNKARALRQLGRDAEADQAAARASELDAAAR
jgi:Flp pilus assembly protein TadD